MTRISMQVGLVLTMSRNNLPKNGILYPGLHTGETSPRRAITTGGQTCIKLLTSVTVASPKQQFEGTNPY